MSAEYPFEKCLLTMPDVVMNKTLGLLDFQAVQCLRKTCSTFRNFIDEVKPDSAFTHLQFSVKPDHITSLYYFNEFSIEVKYTRNGGGCSVEWYGRDQKLHNKLLESVDFFDVASKDISSVLTNQKSVMKCLDVECSLDEIREGQQEVLYQVSEKFLSNLEPCLASKPKKLQVKTFQTKVADETQILHLLPHLEVENLTIRNGRESSNREAVLNMEKLIVLEQWKKLDTLNIFGFCVNLKIEDLLHLKRCFVKYETMNTVMIEELKEAFRTSSHLEFFRIEYGLTDIQDLMDPSYADPFTGLNPFGDVFKRWFFSVSTPERVLKITITPYQIVLDFDLLVNVPEGVTVN
ncbi:hypothetical protein GCK72_004407 [Caenorhabditis remanei]|uniref:F-box domain-containing protein n=1 Tax=Caenorhabditis remanei TaxID=31234 RepID=A0A6A5HBS3_CAERE|nr:hypothetical protein GCK72_004407 [Caenorhabditis remanei]KAF1764459.1 hypothetical protein GCK72_004407 [Caenorhabditis remanei]